MNEKAMLVVIPHYGSDELLSRLLPTLQSCPKLEICVIDNNTNNRGFTSACNEGIRNALSAGYDAVWLLNNDTVVPDVDGAVLAFQKEFQENTKTGVIGCKMLSLDDPDFIHHAGTTQVLPGVHKTGRVSTRDHTFRTKEKWVTGASMVISRSCLEEVGLLDALLFNYASDSDFCYRARLAGFDVVYLPVPILHGIGQSANPSALQSQIMDHDIAYFQNKWMNGKVFEALDTEL